MAKRKLSAISGRGTFFVLVLIAAGLIATFAALRDQSLFTHDLFDFRGITRISRNTHSLIDWVSVSPEFAWLDREALDALTADLANRRTDAFIVVRQNRIAYEWYGASNDGTNRRWATASLAKAIVGGVALWLALGDGIISLDDPASKYIPEWRGDRSKSDITIRQLATHSSGIDAARTEGDRYAAEGWQGDYWRSSPNPIATAITEAPVAFPPGSRYEYSPPGFTALGYAIAAGLKSAGQSDIRSVLDTRIMRPLGVPPDAWVIGYGESHQVGLTTVHDIRGGGGYTARAIARVGQLVLDRGWWRGQELAKPESIARILADAREQKLPLPPGVMRPAAAGWYLNVDGVIPSLPPDAMIGAGAGHRVLLIIPSLDLVAVRLGNNLNDSSPADEAQYWQQLETFFIAPLMATVRPPPYPRSSLISGIRWAPEEEIVRAAEGSDNWPMTWGDDGHIYTAYGDGWGFEPRVPEKLSLGFARLEGTPADPQGLNIRSSSGERYGGGPAGEKASGLLMVDGILYMWTRNSDGDGNGCRLAWSSDHAKFWTWSNWTFGDLGHCTFINYGRNYNDAKDDYVYMLTPDSPSAYDETDELVLTRVERQRITERDAYEFYSGTNAADEPEWTTDFERRGSAFSFPGGVNRADVTYNAPIGRYLMTISSRGNAGGRRQFSMYDAEKPWGPWTSVFFDGNAHRLPDAKPGTDWGESQHIPSKWISRDGLEFHLVYSGGDALSIRKAYIELVDPNTQRQRH